MDVFLKLKNVCQINGGYAFKSDNFEDKGIPIIRIGDISDGKVNISNTTAYIDDNIKKYEKFIINKGDILIALSGATTGKFGIYEYEENSLLNQRVAKIAPYENILNKYLYYYMNELKDIIYSNALGCAQPNISPSEIGELKIYVPQILVQEKIAQVLDKAQELIDKRKAQIEALDELVKSKFIEMFGELSSNINNFEIVNLESLTSKITDGVHSKPEYTTEGVPFISVKDINTGKLKFSECKYISQEAHESYTKRCKPENGDVLYTKVGATYGIPAVVDTDEEFSLYVSVALLKLKREMVNPIYVKESLRSIDIKRQADRQVKGIGVPDLHLIEIKKFKIFNPPIELQNQFADFVNQIDKLKFEMQESLTQLENNFNSLMKRAFKGELFN